MKKITILLLCISIAFFSSAQTVRQIPSVDVKNIKGDIVNTSTFQNDGKPMIIDFWATWCKPCVLELSNIQENFDEWKAETGVKIIAISVDDARNTGKVGPFVAGKAWDYEIYMDPNADFKRLMNVNNIPHTFLVNGKGEIVWQHASYEPGDEDHLYELVKKLARGEEIQSND